MPFANKIEAIKAVRSLKVTVGTPECTLIPNTDRYEIRVPAYNMLGLKDAKDLVEAIMDMGVKSYLEQQLSDIKMKGSINASL